MAKKRTIFYMCLAALLALGVATSVNARVAFAQSSSIQIELVGGNSRFSYIDKKIEPSNHLIAQEIHSRQINGDYAAKKAVMHKCVSMGGTYKTAVLYSMPKLEVVVNKAIAAAQKKPVNSQIYFKPDSSPMFSVSKEIEGYKIDEEEAYLQIYSALIMRPQIKVTLRRIPIPAQISYEDNVRLTQLRSRHTTSYEKSNDNRKHNIALALRKVNGTVLDPDEVFSFNEIVGARNEKNGFKISKIIVKGKYEDGVGGGVCQASTTVYNAAILGGLEIISAYPHSLECGYELASFDCMVNGAYADLKFKNTGKDKVFIKAFGDGKKAVVEVYGSALPYKIKRKSEVIVRNEPPEYQKIIDVDYKYHNCQAVKGEQKVVSYARGQMKSVGYLLYYDKQGNLVKQRKIRSDTYREQLGVIAVAP